MRSRWVPLLRPKARLKETGKGEFLQHSLLRSILIILLIISIIPILLIGTLNLIRSRQLLERQTSQQLESIVKHEAGQLAQFADLRSAIIERMVTDSGFNDSLFTLLNTQPGTVEHQQAQAAVDAMFKSGLFGSAGSSAVAPGAFFDQMFIVRPDGWLVQSTDDKWVAAHFGGSPIQQPVIRDLISTNRSIFAYGTEDRKLVLFISRSFVNEKGAKIATLITTSSTELPYQVLSDASSFLPGANAYYFTPAAKPDKAAGSNAAAGADAGIIGITGNNQLIRLPSDGPQSAATGLSSVLSSLTGQQPGQSLFSAQSFNQEPVIAFAQWLPKYNLGLVLTVSERSAYQLSNFVNPVNIALLIVSLLISGSIVYFGGINLVTPLLRLAQAADSFSSRKWDERVEINRSDEIGMLANSFNHMAETLSEHYRSLEDAAAGGRLGEGEAARQETPPTGTETASLLAERSRSEDGSSSSDGSPSAATQRKYQETALLYQTARQVIHARSEVEIEQSLTNAFLQLPFVGIILTVDGENFRLGPVTDSRTGRIDTSFQNLKIPTSHMVGSLLEHPVVLIEDVTAALAVELAPASAGASAEASAAPSEYSNLLSFLQRHGFGRECRSAALIPVRENGRLSKVLMFGYPETTQITYDGLQPYANLAEIVGASLERQRMVSTFQKRLAELQIMASFSQAISAETDINNLYRVLHEQVIQTLGPDLEFAVAIYNKNENLIEFPYYYENNAAQYIPPSNLGEGVTSVLIQSRRPLLLYTEEAIRAYNPIVSGAPARSWMGVPLIFAGDVVGAILVQDLVNENTFSQDDLNLFMTLAPHIATHVRNAQLYSEMQRALRAYDEEHFLFNTLLDSIPEGISIKNTRGEYIRASESVARIYNVSAEEIIGKTDFDLASLGGPMDHETAERIFREEQLVMSLGKPEIGLIGRSVSPTGETPEGVPPEAFETWTQTSRLPIRTAAGDPYGLMIIQGDVTGLKQAEALAQRRAEQVLTAAEIARDATGTLDAKTLLQKYVNLIRERFGFYQASIFLIDANGEYAVLRESTGPAGEQMMRAGHRLAVGSKSIVGQVTATRQPLIVNDVSKEPIHKLNELLPETRSELAIPLIVDRAQGDSERILGALDVQSTQVNAFNPEDVGILQILADQMAVAVVNSELFTKTQELLAKHRLLRQISIAASSSTSLEDALASIVSGLRTASGASPALGDRVAIFLLNDAGQLQLQASAGSDRKPAVSGLPVRELPAQGICERAVLEKRTILTDRVPADALSDADDPDIRSALAIPILFSDAIIGVLHLESKQAHAFDENDQEILSALGNNLGGVIANIRLVNQVRQQVIRERQLFEVTSKIRHSVDLETILETSAKEIARALGARRATIRITGDGRISGDHP